jgi:hypothetical protein
MADLENVVYNDPNLMDEECYAEWMREGMWKYVAFAVCECCFPSREALVRKRNAQAHQEQLRKRAEEEARKKRAEELASERARREAREADERRRRKRSRERNAKQTARDDYEKRWDILLSTSESAEKPFKFPDIPWPCHAAYSPPTGQGLSLDDLTVDSISEFLFGSTIKATEATQKIKTIRETLLRFHPDKFEGRIISRVSESEKAKVQVGVGIVVRALNELLRM